MDPQSESNYRGTGCGKAARPGLKGSGEATNRSTWKKQTVFWILAVIITLSTAYYQRRTGPTKPVSYSIEISGKHIETRLPRSHGVETDREIRIEAADTGIGGMLIFKRYKSGDPYDTLAMSRMGNELIAHLPSQPPAGKLEYIIILTKDGKEYSLNKIPVVIRFKGTVPAWVLIPHILFIFTAQLLSLVAGLYAIYRLKGYKLYGSLTVVLILVGGFILGPVIQKYAFGAFWTGFPFGQDLTDNKVLFAMVFWILALVMNVKKDRPVYSIIASIIFFLINMIPHSLMGSELDYESGEVLTGMILFL